MLEFQVFGGYPSLLVIRISGGGQQGTYYRDIHKKGNVDTYEILF